MGSSSTPTTQKAIDPSTEAISQASPHSTTAEEILRAIRRIVQGITIHSKKLYKQSGLTVPQLLCLRAIAAAEQGEITAAEVSRHIGIGPATVTGILDRLERSDLVQRVRRSSDRRKVSLVLTEKGRERIAARSLQDQFVAAIMAIDESERTAMLHSLEKVVDMLGASNLDAAPILASGDLNRPPEI